VVSWCSTWLFERQIKSCGCLRCKSKEEYVLKYRSLLQKKLQKNCDEASQDVSQVSQESLLADVSQESLLAASLEVKKEMQMTDDYFGL